MERPGDEPGNSCRRNRGEELVAGLAKRASARERDQQCVCARGQHLHLCPTANAKDDEEVTGVA